MRVLGIVATLVAAIVCSGFGERTIIVPLGLSQQATLYYGAQGTRSAATLPVMCVNTHIATASAAQTAGLLATLKAPCIRTDFNWDHVETVSGDFGWTTNGTPTFAAFFGPLCSAGVKAIFIATYNNPLYASSVFTPVTPGTNATRWGDFGAALAGEAISLGCAPPVIEAYNEANLVNFTTTQWTGSAYAGPFATFLSAVKAAQPTAQVYSSGLAPIQLPPGSYPLLWLPDMLGQLGSTAASVDGYAFHPYNYRTDAPTQTATPDQLLLDLNAFWLMGGSTGYKKPIPVTEWGYPWNAIGSVVDQATLNKQGVYIGWGMLVSIVANVATGSPGIPYFAIYDLVDDGTNYGTFEAAHSESSFGLFFNGSASSGSPITGASAYGIKPSGTAFQSVTTAMQGATTYTIAFDLPNSAPSIRFDKPAGATLAVWTTDAASSKSWSASIGAFSSVSCKDLIGNSVPCNYSAGTLSMTLSTATGPVIATAIN